MGLIREKGSKYMGQRQLREFIKAHGWTQREVAELLGISERSLQMYTSGNMKVRPQLEYALRWLGERKRAADAERDKRFLDAINENNSLAGIDIASGLPEDRP